VYRLSDVEGKLGPKIKEGDGQAPEGFYYVSPSRFVPDTKHHLGLDLGYPNDYDKHHGRTCGNLMIHGGSRAAGAFAVPKKGMEEVYTLASAAVSNGQRFFRVNVFPFRMDDKRMDSEFRKSSKWLDFWINLKEGYDFFENAHFPPDVALSGGDYDYHLK
jgi:murein L,D-transpeptidase YafK